MPADLLISDRFPRTAKYNPEWITASVSGAANPLWMTEWLTEAMDLRPGMRVLDLGCGRAASSVFLRREFGVQVWATDLWFSAEESLQRFQVAGVDDAVFPVRDRSGRKRRRPLPRLCSRGRPAASRRAIDGAGCFDTGAIYEEAAAAGLTPTVGAVCDRA